MWALKLRDGASTPPRIEDLIVAWLVPIIGEAS
jgi:hypothetical protein